MAFQPHVEEDIVIGGVKYIIAEHPSAPSVPYGQEGRQGVVYQLIPKYKKSAEKKAMKVFRPSFRVPSMVHLADQLDEFARMPGLLACERTVLTPQQHSTLLSEHPDLLYAVLMPWIEGPTWMDILLDKKELSRKESLHIARSLAQVLSSMEQKGLAHCDLSAPNLLIPSLIQEPVRGGLNAVELVDVEQMYGPRFVRPEILPAGSLGYASEFLSADKYWNRASDRFTGAILLAEILCWCNEDVRSNAWGESYFHPKEIHQEVERYNLMLETLEHYWSDKIAQLFAMAWKSSVIEDCATFGEWLIELMELNEGAVKKPKKKSDKSSTPRMRSDEEINEQLQNRVLVTTHFTTSMERPANLFKEELKLAKQLEEQEEYKKALKQYKQIYEQLELSLQANLAEELQVIIKSLEEKAFFQSTGNMVTTPEPLPRTNDTDRSGRASDFPYSQPEPESQFETELQHARTFETDGKFEDALILYQSIYNKLDIHQHSNLAKEISIAMQTLEEKIGRNKQKQSQTQTNQSSLSQVNHSSSNLAQQRMLSEPSYSNERQDSQRYGRAAEQQQAMIQNVHMNHSTHQNVTEQNETQQNKKKLNKSFRNIKLRNIQIIGMVLSVLFFLFTIIGYKINMNISTIRIWVGIFIGLKISLGFLMYIKHKSNSEMS